MDAIKGLINSLASPQLIIGAAAIGLFVVLRFIRFFTKIWVGAAVLAAMVGFLAFSMTDPHFYHIVTAPDNVPIVMLIFLVAFFVWYALRKGVLNDLAKEKGGATFEEREGEKVFVWPNLVYTEFICIILCSALLLLWAVVLKAPLEEPANATDTPNPAKAPWYFLGLQEMLVYFDPWMAGVVLPSLVVVGLMAIPFIDRNPKGNGYYTFKERSFAITMYLAGFVLLWCVLIVLGTFLRGPNWNFFGPYEEWNVHKLVPLVNVNLSEFVWVKWLNRGLPQNWFVREIFGFGLIGGYFALLPLVLSRTVLKPFYSSLGAARFAILVVLLLSMVALPAKMALRWAFNLKYLVAIPEYFFNI